MPLFVWALAATSLALCTQLRLGVGSLHVSLSEIFATVAILLSLTRNQRRGPTAFVILATMIVISIGSVFAAQGDQAAVTAVRNLVLPAMLLTALFYARLTADEAFWVLRWFVVGAVGCAILGIQQAMVGSPPAFSLYQVHNYVDLNLHDVMAWKLSIAQASLPIPGQRSLAFGLHLFSNSFAEFLVFALCALLTLWSAKRVRAVLAVPIIGLFCVALLASISRSSWAGAVVVVALYGLIVVRSFVPRLFLTVGAIAVGVLSLDVVQGAIGFDRGGTIQGRQILNQIATSVYTSADAVGLLVGGNAPRYWAYSGAFSSPHNTFLYTLMNFGLLGLVTALGGVIAVFWRLTARVRQLPHDDDWSLALGSLLATVWFFVYGMTWAVVASSDSTFQWVLLAGMGLAAVSARAPVSPMAGAPAADTRQMLPINRAATR